VRGLAAIGRVVSDARGGPLRSRGACIDITARKIQERETLRLRHDIAQVGRFSVMGQLASALAHEINQPLGAILRNAEAASLFMEDSAPDLAEITAIIEDIRRDDQRAGAVIDRMRALLRRQEVATETIDTGQMLGDVVRLLRPDAAARHIALPLDAARQVPPVRGDRVQLQQVLLNLIQNGMDALGPEGTGERTVAVSARQVGADFLEISVADTGGGIDAAAQARLFAPFFTTKAAGLGLGLSISRSIVEAHGGRMHAGNNADGGATFGFTLPIVRA
jgi:C4-dicarboxylate-specific signal transduction histidine kinase